MEKINLFQIWEANGKILPFKAILDSWDESSGHYVLVESIEITKWPYGKAHGQYFFYGKPGRKGLISNSGTYRWKLNKG